MKEAPAPAPPAPAPASAKSDAVETPDYLSSLSVLAAQESELYYWDQEAEQFDNHGIVVCRIVEQPNSNFVYWLTASNDDGFLLSHLIAPEMNQKWTHRLFTLTWNHIGDNGLPHSWLFKFNTEEAFANILEVFTQVMWQSLHQIPWSKAKVYLTLRLLTWI